MPNLLQRVHFKTRPASTRNMELHRNDITHPARFSQETDTQIEPSGLVVGKKLKIMSPESLNTVIDLDENDTETRRRDVEMQIHEYRTPQDIN